MARAIGRTRSWLWWLAGCLCALVFGRGAKAAEGVATPEYGVRVQPVRQAVGSEQQKRAERLVEEYLGAAEPVRPSAEQAAKIAVLVREMGADEFARRKAATETVVGFGAAALGALREAASGGDPEVAERARAAMAEIEVAARAPKIEGLKKLGSAGSVASTSALYRAQTEVKLAAADLKKAEAAGDGAAVAAARARAADARRRASALSHLTRQLMGRMPAQIQADYGVRAIRLR